MIGINPDRIKMIHCTAAEGQKYQLEMIEYDKEIRKLGPSPIRTKNGTPKKGKAEAKAKA
jgi:coenzyme F420-reducing hydrogenase delta subunit